MINYIDKGKGKPVLLLHGYCENHQVWDGFMDALAVNNRIIAIDLPGFGESTELAEGFSLEEVAIEINQFLINLNIHECTVIGHSLGGYIGMALLELFPSMVSSMGLFHSSVFEDSEVKKEGRNKTIKFLDDHGVEPFITPFVPNLFTPKNRETLKHEINNLIDIGKKQSLYSIKGYAAAMRDRKDYAKLASEVNIPFLFIVGKKDQAITFGTSLKQIELPKYATTLILEDCAHMGMYENKVETLKAVADFIR